MLLLKNGVIATMDETCPTAEAVVVDGEHFAFVGSNADAEAFANNYSRGELETIDLQGGFLMAGFNDSHMHFIHYVKAKQSVDLFGVGSMAELKEKMRQGLANFDGSGGRFLIGEGWNQELFSDEKRFPTRYDLDEITTEYPILIMRTCFHVGTLNSKAMEILGLNRETAKSHGSFAEVDANGEPNGVIKENYLDDTKGQLPSLSIPELLKCTVDAQHDLFAEGLTSVQTDDFKYAPEGKSYDLMEGLMALSRSGELKLRIAEQALLTDQASLDEFFARGGASYGASDRFRISTVKILADGSLGARTAYMQVPYADAPDTVGLPIYENQQELNDLVLTSHLHNMPTAIHVIGDGAAQMSLDAIEYAQKAAPWHNPRHGLVHCQIMTQPQLEKMRELDVQAFTQPVFINGDMHIAPSRLGEERVRWSYSWKTMLDLGIHQSFGTDCPVERFRPMEGVYCAVTRRDFTGFGPFLPEQAVSVQEALYAYTAAGAYASGEEHIKGKIRPGMLADFILMDRNLYTCPSEELYHAQVLRTWVGGECVYTAE